MRRSGSLSLMLALAAVPGAPSQTSAPAPPAAASPADAPPSPAPQGPAATITATPEQTGGIITGTVTASTSGPGGVVVAPASPQAAGTGAASPPKSNSGVPLPGVTVTATNTLTGKKYAAATDVAGAFRLLIPRNGRYVLRAEFAAFAPATGEVLLNAAQHTGSVSFALELASRAAARQALSDSASASAETALAGALGLTGSQTQALRRGLQSLSAGGSDAESASQSGGNTGAALPSLGSLGNSDASDSVAVNGQGGQTNGLANFNEDEIHDRIENAIAQARRNGGQEADIANAVVGMVGGMMAGGGGPGGGGPGGGPGGGVSGGGVSGGGGPGGGGMMMGRGPGGGGGFRNFNPTQIHGNLFYSGGNGALDATKFSLTGTPIQPAYSTNRFGLNITGSPYIPGLFKPSKKQFVFLNITGSRNENPVNLYGTVPTSAMRRGDFSGLTRTVNGTTTQVTLYDPQTGLPFGCQSSTQTNCATNIIPAGRLSTQALALLSFYPTANQAVTGATDTLQNYNYQRVTTAGQNGTQIAARFVRNFGDSTGRGGGFGGFGPGFGGPGFGGGGRHQQSTQKVLRQNMNAGFNGSHAASDSRNFAPSLDGKSLSDGLNLSLGYSIGYGRLNNNLSLVWNRSHAQTTNLFTGTGVDPASGLNIPKPTPLSTGFYNGVPTIGLTNFTGLSGTNPSDRVQQTINWGDQLRWSHARHNMNFGFQVRHVQNNVLGGTNVVGAFTFSGVFTQAPGAGTSTSGSTSTDTGNSFADFLLGAPQQSKIQAGRNKIHLRETVFNLYANDDWRALPNLTINAGLRYEYFGPYSELNNQLVNLDHNSGFTLVSAVQPGGTGPYSGKFPRSLVNPDRTLFLPTVGIAWKPAKLKNTVVRAGYGINYNTSQYGAFANSLSFQVPFAVTQTNIANTQGCGSVTSAGTNGSRFTLDNAFNCTTTAITNNFAVNKNYRLGRVQVVNFGIQHTFGLGILLNVDYNGSFGANLDLLRAPGRTANGIVSNSQAYTFEDSVGESRGNFLLVNLRKRMSRGIAIQTSYRYGHSIDNASSVGGSGNNTIVQNDQRLDLEFGNSTFDLRHQLSGNFVAELPFGENRALLHNGGLWAKALDNFSFSGNYTFATGSYATPQYQNTAAQLATGGNYTLRPDRVFTEPIAGAGTLRSWFNTAAFTSPASSDGFGTASRNSIRLPGTVSVNMSINKRVRFGDTKNFDAGITANNVFNTVQYSGVNTVLNSSTFGQVTGVADARKFSFTARYRF